MTAGFTADATTRLAIAAVLTTGGYPVSDVLLADVRLALLECNVSTSTLVGMLQDAAEAPMLRWPARLVLFFDVLRRRGWTRGGIEATFRVEFEESP